MKQWIFAIGLALLAAPAVLHATEPYKCPKEIKVDPVEQAKAKAAAEAQRKTLQFGVKRDNVDAMIDLASLMEQGDDAAPIDRTGAFDLFEKAADKRDRVGRQKTCLAYLLGEGRPRNVAKGMPYCNALGIKDGVGLFSAAYDYQLGLSGPKDEDVAMGLYVQAVDLGSGDAAAALGRKALELGKPEAARQWFRRGVYLGSADAMDALAVMLETGQGGAKDTTEARWLYAGAGDRGNAHAAAQTAALDAAQPEGNLSKALPVCLSETSKTGVPILRSYTDKRGAHQEKIGFPDLFKILTDNFPQGAMESQVEGHTTIECFIAGDHKVDVCLIRNEYPIGYGYGPTVETIFNGHITIADLDAGGNPTEHRLMKLKVNFAFR